METKNGDYEYIDYCHYKPVPYDRLMSWKAGEGSIGWGEGSTIREDVTKSKEDKLLPKNNGAVVMETKFKLVRRD